MNVAAALANWGVPVTYFTAMPRNYLSNEIMIHLEKKGIDTERIMLQGNRIGAYFIGEGADLKHAAVIYDRAGSSFSTIEPGTIDWDRLFNGVSWFHFSAINPAISELSAAICLEAAREAHERGLFVSIDLNYRQKLWQWGKQPVEVMPRIIEYCNLVMGNPWALDIMTGIGDLQGFEATKENCRELTHNMYNTLLKRFSNVQTLAFTFRFDKADVNGKDHLHYFGVLCNEEECLVSKEYQIDDIVDRVGTGDSFMAGLIYSKLNKQSMQEAVNFAAAAAVTKFSIRGDSNTSTVEEINRYAGN